MPENVNSHKAYRRVFTGPLVSILLLEERFRENHIPFVRRDDFQSGAMAGFGGGLPGQVQLFVPQYFIMIAKQIVTNSFPDAETHE